MSTATTTSLETWARRVQRHLDRVILPFWLFQAPDWQRGGFHGLIDVEHRPDPEAARGLILNARLLWTFSTLAQRESWPVAQALAQRAWREIRDRFWDARHEGLLWSIDPEGRCLDDRKRIYGQAFGVYGMTAYAAAFQDAEAWRRAECLLRRIESHAADPDAGGYVEVCQRDWSVDEADQQLSEKDLPARKSMNNHLHLLEAYTAWCRHHDDPARRGRLIGLVECLIERIASPDGRHLRHFFDADWKVLSADYTYGHDIEASWLLWEAAEVLGEPAWRRRVEPVCLTLAESCLDEAVAPSGGIYYGGREGRATVRDHEWWPQAEAVVGFLNAYDLTGRWAFLEAAMGVWDFIETTMADLQRGEWFWRVDPQGRPDRTEPKLSLWKGPYHGVRACLEVLERLAI